MRMITAKINVWGNISVEDILHNGNIGIVPFLVCLFRKLISAIGVDIHLDILSVCDNLCTSYGSICVLDLCNEGGVSIATICSTVKPVPLFDSPSSCFEGFLCIDDIIDIVVEVVVLTIGLFGFVGLDGEIGLGRVIVFGPLCSQILAPIEVRNGVVEFARIDFLDVLGPICLCIGDGKSCIIIDDKFCFGNLAIGSVFIKKDTEIRPIRIFLIGF